MGMENKSTYNTVLSHFGNQNKLAKALGISKQAVNSWAGKIPKLRAFEIEKITSGKIKASDLLKPEDAA
jgi:transcriptional repressor of cell division inhibition gene dicB